MQYILHLHIAQLIFFTDRLLDKLHAPIHLFSRPYSLINLHNSLHAYLSWSWRIFLYRPLEGTTPHNKCTGYYFARIILMAMNVAWRGTRRPERDSTGVETSSRMGVVTGDAAGRMRCHGNSIIDLRRGWTMGPSKTSSVSRRSRHPRPDDISTSISDHDRFSFGIILFFAVLIDRTILYKFGKQCSCFNMSVLYITVICI